MYDDNTTARMLLTTAVFAAVAAFLVGPASAFVMDVEGGGGSGAATVTAQPQVEPGTIPYLSHGIGVDESQFSGATAAKPGDPGTIPYLSHGVGVDQSLGQGETSIGLTGDSALTRADSGTETTAIPYLSHGIGVDQSLFQGEQKVLGLTGDTPIARVVSTEPKGLAGDTGRTRVDSLQANATLAASDGDVNWTWVGFGAGMAALLAAATAALYLSARNRDRVALP